ncbi:MAG: type II toxin-antitoxin system VapC family toxin [Solirubrobacterales bacterium]
MTFFLDANVIVYTASQNRWREACSEILAAVMLEQADGMTSVGVLEEVWHVELSGRIERVAGLTNRTAKALSPLLPLSEVALRHALELPGSTAGSYDRLHVGTCLEHGIETIVSADRALDDFEEVRRVDPLDAKAVAELLAG